MKYIITALLILTPAILNAAYMVEYSTGGQCEKHLKHIIAEDFSFGGSAIVRLELKDGSSIRIRSPYIKIVELKKPEDKPKQKERDGQ